MEVFHCKKYCNDDMRCIFIPFIFIKLIKFYFSLLFKPGQMALIIFTQYLYSKIDLKSQTV